MICKVKKGSIYYEVIGEGFPLLILHAMGTDHHSMKAWLEPIFGNTSGFKRVYIDIPAHGRSLIDKTVDSTDDFLENLLEFIKTTLGDKLFSLIGSSFGGYLAQGILDKRRNQVNGICLLVPALHKKERTLPKRVIFEKDEELLEGLDPDIRAAFETLLLYQNKQNLALFMEEIQPGRLLANRGFLSSDWKPKRYFLLQEPFKDVKEMPHPALFLLGKNDYICGYEDHRLLVDKFPNSKFAVLEQAGHMLQIEKREEVQSLVKEWLVGTH